ncbi:MAG: tetratricopeptide repeat protein [Proteobacteria bacterium]|nr:tetratricopeptide repeat protein [Pseudomonadota bacterium]
MVRKRLRTRDQSPSIIPGLGATSLSELEQQRGSDGFALAFSGGRGILALTKEALSQAIVIDRLELFISEVTFPFDITAGVQGLRHRRHVLGRLKITVTLDGLEEICRHRLQNSSWCNVPTISFEKDHAAVLLEYGPKGSRIPISFRLVPALRNDLFEVLIDETRAYGSLPANTLLVAAAGIKEMTGLRSQGPWVALPDPVKFALIALLPSRGWRLPDYDQVKLYKLELLPDRVVLDYRHIDLFDEATATPFTSDEAGGMLRLRKMEEARIVREGDTLLADGQVAEARSIYAKLLDRDPDSPVIAARLAMVDVTNRELRDTARSLAAKALNRSTERCDLAAVLAHGAALDGDTETEEKALSMLAQTGNSLERLAANLRRGRLLLDSEPARAIKALQEALTARREDRAALWTLLKAHAVTGNRDQVHALIPRWIAVHKHAPERVAAYAEVGNLLLRQVDDPVGAAKYFERAALNDPKNSDTAWGLADALARAGEKQRAIAQFERLAHMCGNADDPQGAARALAAIGEIWIEANETSLAVQRLREALEIAPDLSRERVRLAYLLLGMSRQAEAASELETALHRAGPERSEAWWAEAALDLARIYLEELDDPSAAESWARTAIDYPEREVKAREYLLTALERGNRLNVLIEELERESELSPSPDNILRLARTHHALGDLSGAHKTLEHAVNSFPESLELVDALIDINRETENYVGLRDALVKRVASIDSANQRASLDVEIGRLELFEIKDPDAAIPWLKRALKNEATQTEAGASLDLALDQIRQKAEEFRESGDLIAAHKLFATLRMESRDLKKFAAALGEAETAFELGDQQGALQAAMMTGQGPTEFRARAARVAANAFLELEGPDEAVRYLEQAAENLDPQDATSLLFFASEISAETLGDNARARVLLEHVINIDPRNEKAEQALIDLLEAAGDRIGLAKHLVESSGKENSDEQMRRAVDIFFSENEPAIATEVLEKLYKQSNRLEDARLLARALKELGQVDALLELVRERAEAEEDPAVDEQILDELEMLADLLESQEEIEAASKVTEELARYCEPDGIRCARAARLAQTMGQVENARRLWSEAIKRKPEPAWIARLVKLLDPDKDKTELNGLLKKLRGREDALELRERLHLLNLQVDQDLAAGREDEAVEQLANMVELAPSNNAIWNRMTAVLERRGKWELLAEQMYRRLSILDKPGDLADANAALGRLLETKLGDEAGAQAVFDKALMLVPDHQIALKARAALAYKRQRWDRLEQLLEQLDPDHIDADVNLWRASVAERMGRTEEAVALYQELVDNDSSNESASQGLARLEQDTDLEDKLSNAFEKLRREKT